MPEDDDRDRQARVALLLEDNIRTEIQAQNAGAHLDLSPEAITRLAWGIRAELLYAFAVDWSPRWVKPGQFHVWQESGDFLARCPACLQDSPPAKSLEEATAWASSHQSQHTPAHTPGSSEPGQQI